MDSIKYCYSTNFKNGRKKLSFRDKNSEKIMHMKILKQKILLNAEIGFSLLEPTFASVTVCEWSSKMNYIF